MNERLFLSAGFSDFLVGLAQGEEWRYVQKGSEPITEQLFRALQPCIEKMNWPELSIFLLNGPGSTLGIRTFCAFIRTLLALKKITSQQVWVCNSLHFAQFVLHQRGVKHPICARVNLTQTLCLCSDNDTIHPASDAEKSKALWWPHPCLPKEISLFYFTENEVLPFLQPKEPWYATDAPDVF